MTSLITEKCLSDIINELAKFTDKKSCTKLELLSLIGKLLFVTSRSYIHKETNRVIKEGEILALSNKTK